VAFLYKFKQFQTFLMITFFVLKNAKLKSQANVLVFWTSKCLLYCILFELDSIALTVLFALVLVTHMNVN